MSTPTADRENTVKMNVQDKSGSPDYVLVVIHQYITAVEYNNGT